MGEWSISSMLSFTSALHGSGQLHTPAASSTGHKTLVPTAHEARLIPGGVQTL